jgi:hypothetical protein
MGSRAWQPSAAIQPADLDDGLGYMARQVVKVLAEKIELVIENYDFRRQ